MVKQVHYSSECFTTILLSAPGVQRPYLTFYPAAFISLAYPSTSEKELGFYFSTIHVRKRTTGRRGSPSDRFIKVVWHIRSPRLLPRPRVGNARERETRDILFYLLFHFKATSRQSSRSLARHLRRIKADGHKVRKRLVLRHLGIPADIRSTGEGRSLWSRSLRRNRSCVWFN